MKKYILIGITVLLIGFFSIVFYGVMNLGELIKTATETYGPKITKTEVKLDSVDISILSGSSSLSGFILGNPKGFSMPNALECNEISVKVDTNSLTTDRIIIEEIFVDGPVISYEKKGTTDNFNTIVNNINKTIASEQKAEKKGQQEQAAETGAQKSIQINNFIVKNGKVNLAGSLLDRLGEVGVGIDLPDTHIKDIGKGKELTPAEAFSIILKDMTGDVGKTVAQQMSKLIGNSIEEIGNGAKGLGNTVKGLFGD